MSYMKYLVFALDDNSSAERIYLFPQEDNHKNFAERATPPGWHAVRGGMAVCEGEKLLCWSEAFSLNLKSDPRLDTELLRHNLINGYGCERSKWSGFDESDVRHLADVILRVRAIDGPGHYGLSELAKLYGGSHPTILGKIARHALMRLQELTKMHDLDFDVKRRVFLVP